MLIPRSIGSIPRLALPAALALLSGCASVSVKNAAQTGEPTHRPAKILVADFDTKGGKWDITNRTFSHDEFKRRLSYALAEDIAKDLRRFVGPAERVASSSAPVPPGDWLVTGHFTRVSEGNFAERIVIGLGVGASKVETRTFVSEGGDRSHPFLRFATTGGSNAMPGAAFNTNPLSVVTTGIGQAKLGVKDDSNRTGKMIAAEILDYMKKRQWVGKASLKPKHPGQFQILQPQVSPATKQPARSAM